MKPLLWWALLPDIRLWPLRWAPVMRSILCLIGGSSSGHFREASEWQRGHAWELRECPRELSEVERHEAFGSKNEVWDVMIEVINRTRKQELSEVERHDAFGSKNQVWDVTIEAIDRMRKQELSEWRLDWISEAMMSAWGENKRKRVVLRSHEDGGQSGLSHRCPYNLWST
jgi:hypothetical protein